MSTMKSGKGLPHEVLIYALTDPRSDLVRYVGKTQGSLDGRLRKHKRTSIREPSSTKCNQWLTELREKGLAPEIHELDRCRLGTWEFYEQTWISVCKDAGFELLNMTIGGGATTGHRHKESTKILLRAAAKKQFEDPVYRKISSEAAKAQWKDPAMRAHLVVKLKEAASKEAYLENQRDKKKALWATREYREKVLESRSFGQHSIGAKRMWSKPEYRAKRSALIAEKKLAAG